MASDSRFTVIRLICDTRDDCQYVHSPDLPGLHVTASNQAAAFEEAKAVIKTLFKANRGLNIKAIHIVEELDSFVESDIPPSYQIACTTQKLALER